MNPVRGALPPVAQESALRVTYADTDVSGLLYYGAWFPHMERLQSEWFWQRGLRQDSLADVLGCYTLTRATTCEYLSPARLYDEIRLEMFFGHLGQTSLSTAFRMTRIDDDCLVARASLTLVCLDPASGTPTAVPEALSNLVRPHLLRSDNL